MISATEDKVAADLTALKSACLYAENLELASSRLYYTLLAIRMHKKYIKCDIPQSDIDRLEQAAGLIDDVNSQEIGTYLPVPNRDDLLAVGALSKGLKLEAYSIVPFRIATKRSDDTTKSDNTTVATIALGMMRGEGVYANAIPILDQSTLDRMQGFRRVTLEKVEPQISDPILSRQEVVLARRSWLANEFFGHMPAFPNTKWDLLMKMRDRLRPERDSLLGVMRDIAHDMAQLTEDRNEPETPGSIARYAEAEWELKIKGEINQIKLKFEGLKLLPELSRFTEVGTLTSSISLAIGLGANYPAVTTAGATIALSTLAQSIVKQVKARRNIDEQIRLRPYWFLQQGVKTWGAPNWRQVTV